jgi:hypothetical protein
MILEIIPFIIIPVEVNVLQSIFCGEWNALKNAHLLQNMFSIILVMKHVRLTTTLNRLMEIITDVLQHAHHIHFFTIIIFALLPVHQKQNINITKRVSEHVQSH